MGIKMKIISSALVVGIAGLISSSFAHLPITEAAFNDLHMKKQSKIGRSRLDADTSGSPYDVTKDYAGGSIVSHGEFNNMKLYWTNSWYADAGDVPGQFADSGGTSAWGLLNSYAKSNGTQVEWVGWNSNVDKYTLGHETDWTLTAVKNGNWGSQIDSKGPGAYLPTWKDGAEAAYSMIHDDIGAMDFNGSVKPSIDLFNTDAGAKYSRIRNAWGVFVGESENSEWAGMREMVKMGIEMVNHSYDHTSAADQWQWLYQGDTVTMTDPSFPKELMNLTVDSTLTSTKDIDIDVPYIDYKNGDVNAPETLHLQYTVKVSSDYQFVDSVFTNIWGDEEHMYPNKGKILAVHKGWSDAAVANVKMYKVYCVPGWTASRYKVNIKGASDIINQEIYDNSDVITGIANSPYFKQGKKVEFYVYPYDAYSDVTHDSLYANGIIGARGGAKSGSPVPSDFFQPFRIDFDAFYMKDQNQTEVFPDNPHQRLTLNGLVDRLIKGQGYMIREIHAVAHVDNPSNWADANDQSKGGWWGGVPDYLLAEHYDYLNTLIDAHKLVVFTPSEAIKYRLTRNFADAVSWDESTGKLSVSMKTGFDTRYYDEISVIVVFSKGTDKIDVVYDDNSHPRIPPLKMNTGGTAWSISIDPSKGTETVKVDTDWSAVVDSKIKSTKLAIGYSGIVGGKIALRLPEGNFKVRLFDLSGKLVKSEVIKSTNKGLVTTNLNVNDLASRMFILNVVNGGVSVFNKSIILKK